MNPRTLILLFPSVWLLACGHEQVEAESPAKKIDTITVSAPADSIAPAWPAENRGTDIYGQIWMTDNLSRVVFNNGDRIPEAKSAADWLEAGKAEKPAWCWYNFGSISDSSKVRLYNYFAVIDPRGLAPQGWHIPTMEEFETLITNNGGKKLAGKTILASAQWGDTSDKSYRAGGNATRTGMRSFNGGYSNLEDFGYWWSRTSRANGNAWHFVLNHRTSVAKLTFSQQLNGFAVRCIKDK